MTNFLPYINFLKALVEDTNLFDHNFIELLKEFDTIPMSIATMSIQANALSLLSKLLRLRAERWAAEAMGQVPVIPEEEVVEDLWNLGGMVRRYMDVDIPLEEARPTPTRPRRSKAELTSEAHQEMQESIKSKISNHQLTIPQEQIPLWVATLHSVVFDSITLEQLCQVTGLAPVEVWLAALHGNNRWQIEQDEFYVTMDQIILRRFDEKTA